jgi:ABC-2 type transport system ATP-binding protein
MTYTVQGVGITKAFGDNLVLDGVDLAVQSGAVFGLLGPNGAGKSTLVRILATLVRPDAGTATIAGHDLLADPTAVKASISLTGQHTAIDDMLTGRENLEMMARLRRLPRRDARARVRELLAEFDLTGARDRRAGAYSGGMKRRLDLAIGMIKRPALMFLDEPTSGLDPRSREQLWATIRGIVDDGVTGLLTTQYLEEADQLADFIGVLDHGQIVARGTPDGLKAGLGTDLVRLQFADPETYAAARARLGSSLRSAEGRMRTIEVATDGSATALSDLLDELRYIGAPAQRASTHQPSLDDVFLTLTNRGDHATAARVKETA